MRGDVTRTGRSAGGEGHEASRTSVRAGSERRRRGPRPKAEASGREHQYFPELLRHLNRLFTTLSGASTASTLSMFKHSKHV